VRVQLDPNPNLAPQNLLAIDLNPLTIRRGRTEIGTANLLPSWRCEALLEDAQTAWEGWCGGDRGGVGLRIEVGLLLLLRGSKFFQVTSWGGNCCGKVAGSGEGELLMRRRHRAGCYVTVDKWWCWCGLRWRSCKCEQLWCRFGDCCDGCFQWKRERVSWLRSL